MPRLGPAAKLRRVLEFMIGLRDDRVLLALAECGFTPADRDQGWELLRALGSTQTVATPGFASEPLMALDAWRQRWLRIAGVSLVQDFPRVYDQIFAGIDDSRKPAFAVVPVFADRIDKLQRANDAMSRAALGKLRRRGLTDERIAEARQAFARFSSDERQPLPDLNRRRAKIQAAESALWKYFVEWGQIARAAINEPRLLALLGYGAGTNDDEEQPEPPQIVESATPIALATKKKRPAARGKKKLRSRSTS